MARDLTFVGHLTNLLVAERERKTLPRQKF
jgi:hypothetical protein